MSDNFLERKYVNHIIFINTFVREFTLEIEFIAKYYSLNVSDSSVKRNEYKGF